MWSRPGFWRSGCLEGPQLTTGTLALASARIVTMADDHVIERGTIVVDGSRIACVGDCDTSSADRVVDVSGKTIIPGLLDVHAHHLTFAGNSFIPPQRRHESARYLVYLSLIHI